MIPGAKVRILEPFTSSFPEVYTIAVLGEGEEEGLAYLEGLEPAFDFRFLEVVND